MRPEPTGWISPSWSARSSLAWTAGGSSPTSSRISVPPSACAKKPGRLALAPVNAPRAWPNSSASASSAGSAAQLKRTSGLSARVDLRVEELGDELLAGAGLAAHEHGDVARGDAAGRFEQAAHRARGADDAATERLLGGEAAVVDAQAARLERALDDDRDLVDVERLREVVVRAVLHRGDRDASRSRAR